MKINEIIPETLLKKLSRYLSECYPIKSKRIYELMLQVNSVDVALELLIYHHKSSITIDNIVMQYLTGRDNAENKKEFDYKFNKNKYNEWYKKKGKKWNI